MPPAWTRELAAQEMSSLLAFALSRTLLCFRLRRCQGSIVGLHQRCSRLLRLLVVLSVHALYIHNIQTNADGPSLGKISSNRQSFNVSKYALPRGR